MITRLPPVRRIFGDTLLENKVIQSGLSVDYEVNDCLANKKRHSIRCNVTNWLGSLLDDDLAKRVWRYPKYYTAQFTENHFALYD